MIPAISKIDIQNGLEEKVQWKAVILEIKYAYNQP